MKYFLFFLFSILILSVKAQNPKKIMKEQGNVPVFFIDSIRVSKSKLMQYPSEQISAVSVYKDSNAVKLVGEEGKNGVVYVETKKFVKNRYWKYFSSKSEKYLAIVPNPRSDTAIQYIINDKVLKTNFESDLSQINDSVFKEIIIIDKNELKRKYAIEGKNFGVIIKTIKPIDLHQSKTKF